MIKIATTLLKIGKIILRNNILSLPNVASIVFVNVNKETYTGIKMIIFLQILDDINNSKRQGGKCVSCKRYHNDFVVFCGCSPINQKKEHD